MEKKLNLQIKSWQLALILIFALSIVGLGISFLVGNFIPFGLLVGFSIIYSVDRWFIRFIRKYPIISKSYRLLINLSLLALLGLIIWSAVKLFTQQFLENSLIGSLVFIVEIILLIWVWRIVSKHSYRRPSMKLTVFSLVCLFVILAFAGVQPASGYKDAAFTAFSQAGSQDETSSTSGSKEGNSIFGTLLKLFSQGETGEESNLDVARFENWEVALKKCTISGNRVRVKLSITSHWNSPRYFGGNALSPYTFICIDQYGKIFEDAIEEKKTSEAWQEFFEGKISVEPEIVNFYKGEYYPEEIRTGELEFIINPKSGDVALYLGRFVGFTSKMWLFDLGKVS